MSIFIKRNDSFVSEQAVLSAALDVFSILDTSVAAQAAAFVSSGDFTGYLGMSVNPYAYSDAATFFKDYQAVQLLRKAEFLPSTFDKQHEAEKVFWNAEKDCERANARFNRLSNCSGVNSLEAEVKECGNYRLSVLMNTRALIRKILGPVPKQLDFRFGPGATSLLKRSITLPKKYTRIIHVTPELYPYWRDVAGPTWCNTISDVHYQTGSGISFVPKDAKKHRTIGVEPHLNIYAQLGVGAFMRRRFKPWIDLKVGQERNRLLASRAQKGVDGIGGLATIDFSSASDTISRGVVDFLLPHEWTDLLDKVRSHRFIMNGEEYTFEKHSSMGNGYTFELESIIFYSLAHAVVYDGKYTGRSSIVSSYGDDVILPQSYAAAFIDVAEYCGFTVNKEKSFLSGSFFESCGHDYFDGVNVRPALWRKFNPSTVFKVHNDVRRMASLPFLSPYQKQRCEAWAFSYRTDRQIPSEIQKCLIPDGYGNAGFVVPFDAACPDLGSDKVRRGWDGFSTKALNFVADKQRHSGLNGYLASLDCMTLTSESPIRGSGGCRVSKLHTFGTWSDFNQGATPDEVLIDDQLEDL